MRNIVWILIITTVPSVVFADEWSNAITDFEIFQEQLMHDEQALTKELTKADLEAADELFPVSEDEEFDAEPDYTLSETHVTIKVDGVPVVLDDVPVFEWFAVYVRDAAERGIVSGYKKLNGLPSGKYGPADKVTIAQLAKMAVLAGDIDPYNCGDELKNKRAEYDWSEDYIRCAEKEGWIVYSDGSVDITRPATRAEVVVTVLQAFRQRISPRSGTVFADVGTSSPLGAAIETAANAGIVSGYSDKFGNPTGYFGPEDPVNRAETAKIFSLAFQVYGE